MLQTPWKEATFVSFDTETTGQYPLTAEVCEVAAVKWQGGKVIDSYQSLVKPKNVIPDEVIEIHGITNEMVQGAPLIGQVAREFYDFIDGTALIAHHAAFDLGFLAHEFEKEGLHLPNNPVVCTSWLSRMVFPKSSNHRLQTLVRYLKIPPRTAHRALEDSEACLDVALHCFEKVGPEATIQEIIDAQTKTMTWRRFSMEDLLETDKGRAIIAATREGRDLTITYEGGSNKGHSRDVQPMGVVRSLDGDYLMAFCPIDQRKKRYRLDRISAAKGH